MHTCTPQPPLYAGPFVAHTPSCLPVASETAEVCVCGAVCAHRTEPGTAGPKIRRYIVSHPVHLAKKNENTLPS